MLAIKYHVHICQVLPQLSCGDTSQWWLWFKECKRYFCKIENFPYGEIDERVLSNPHPWRIWVNSNDITPSSPEHWRSLIGFNTFIYHEVLSCRHFPHYWTRVRGIRPSPVDSLAKGQWCGALIFCFAVSVNTCSKKLLIVWWLSHHDAYCDVILEYYFTLMFIYQYYPICLPGCQIKHNFYLWSIVQQWRIALNHLNQLCAVPGLSTYMVSGCQGNAGLVIEECTGDFYGGISMIISLIS